jgi:signal transduction histidine kinase
MPGLAAGLTDALAGTALLAGGLATWRRPGGRLLALAGVLWFAGDVSSSLLYAHRGPLFQLLAGPFVGAAAWIDGVIPALARLDWATTALSVGVGVAAIWRVRGARGLERRRRRVSAVAAVLVAATLAAAPSWAYDLAVAVSACALALEARWAPGRAITGLVLDLGDEPRALQPALAHMLGEPGLVVAYRVDGWVDEAGRAVEVPDDAVLVGDDAAIVGATLDRELAASVAAAARLVVTNVRMRNEVATRGREVAASRRRLLDAADEERRRFGEELRMGVERRLEAIADALRGEEAVARLACELDAARGELHGLALGLHPPALIEDGLGAALAELATRCPVPVRLDAGVPRLPASQEAAAYFVCSEALTNVAKYAGATRVEITVSAGERLRVRVRDDGSGGADPARGSGLRGLADRIEALGGVLRVESPAGAGTLVEAEIPLGAAVGGVIAGPIAVGAAS